MSRFEYTVQGQFPTLPHISHFLHLYPIIKGREQLQRIYLIKVQEWEDGLRPVVVVQLIGVVPVQSRLCHLLQLRLELLVLALQIHDDRVQELNLPMHENNRWRAWPDTDKYNTWHTQHKRLAPQRTWQTTASYHTSHSPKSAKWLTAQSLVHTCLDKATANTH